jgi:hypothetical protein
LHPGPPGPPPELGHKVALAPASGKVLVKAPGETGFRALTSASALPVGATIDATQGHVTLVSARDASGSTQSVTVWGGSFEVRQAPDGRGVTDLVLAGGSFEGCGHSKGQIRSGGRGATAARSARSRRRVIRRLWATDDHGRFRTHGRNSVATVRGTSWLTVDTCRGTLTRVRRGKVIVRDRHRHRRVVVRAGHSYLARG